MSIKSLYFSAGCSRHPHLVEERAKDQPSPNFGDDGQDVEVFRDDLLTGDKRSRDIQRVAEFAGVWQEAAAAVNATVVDPSEVLYPKNECIYRLWRSKSMAIPLERDLRNRCVRFFLGSGRKQSSQELAKGHTRHTDEDFSRRAVNAAIRCSVRRVASADRDLPEAEQDEHQCNSR
jgi:hypothetical protein